jgi:hypothetical protein
MNGKQWQLAFLVVVIVLFLALVLNWFGPNEQSQENVTTTDVRAYLPPLQGITYFFVGEGMEYAAFSRRITHVAPGFIQLEDLSGTNLAQVLETSPQELRITWSEEEFYENDSLLDAPSRAGREGGRSTDLVLLKAPLTKGNTWSDERFSREIVSVDETVTVPLGVFYDVVVVKNKSATSNDFVQYEYYAKNIGLIKRESLFVQNGQTVAVVSSLKSITGPFPQ